MPSLDAVWHLGRGDALVVAGVVTQPDRPGSRGRVSEPPVKRRARELDVPVLQPERLSGKALDGVLALRPDALVWAAYGNKIPGRLLEAVDGRAVNVHASLLPRWRGAAPIAHAILAGDAETGVTLMEGTTDLDAGPVLAQEALPISDEETRGELEERLATLGGDLLARELLRYLAGRLVGRIQDERMVTLAPKLEPPGGELDFARPAEEVVRTVRAFTPDPGAFTTFRGRRLGVRRAHSAGGRAAGPGTLEVRSGVPHVAASGGWLSLDEVQPAGKRAMSGAEWARGLRDLRGGERLPS